MPVVERKAEDIIEQNMSEFGAYVILQRAIPDLRDGLKPGQRRILYTMHLEKATRFTKSANIEGATMRLHPHGSTYGTVVNMVQVDRNQTPLVVGKGNFGQSTSRELQPGASRYTEVKLSEMGIEMLKDLNKNLVDFIPNYDGTMMMPEVLPVKFPVLFSMPSSGVAYGMASSIPSFNLKELCAALVKRIESGTRTLLVPDFATGGYVIKNTDAFKKINLEGSGSVYLRGKAEIVGNEIYITEIPFSTTREAIIEKIIELAKTGKLKEVSAAKDLTGLKGMNIYIKCKRGTDMKVTLEKIYQMTPLQSSFSTNLNMIVNKTPRTLGVWDALDEWLKWRKETIVRGLKFEVGKMEKDLHFLKGLEKVLLDIDKAVEIIRHSSNETMELNLMKEFDIDEVQAKAVGDMRLRNINQDYIINKIKDIKQLEDDIAYNKYVIETDSELDKLIIKGLNEISEKYGKERQTKIIEVNTEKIKQVKKKIEEVPNYPVKLFITKDGYVKKTSTYAEASDQYIKPGDEIVNVFDSFNNAELLVFGSDHSCYKIKVSSINEVTNKSLGTFIPSLCDVDEIVGVSVLDSVHTFIIIGYDNNKIAKVKLDSFNGNRKKLANSLAKNANCIGIITFKDEGHFLFETTKAKFKIPTSKYELKERYVQGVYGPRKGQLRKIEQLQ